MCQCPREKGPTPLCLFGVRGGEEQKTQSISARRRAVGPVHRTPHFHEACYQGNKTVFNWGPEGKKKEDERDLFFGV